LTRDARVAAIANKKLFNENAKKAPSVDDLAGGALKGKLENE